MSNEHYYTGYYTGYSGVPMMAAGQAPAQPQAPMGHPGYGQQQGMYQTAGHPGHSAQNPAGHPQQQQQGMYQSAGYPGWNQASRTNLQYQQQTPFLNFTNDRFLKGLLIGAAAAYLLTNESVQRTVIRGAVRTWSLLQGGVAELQERFQDAEAELRAEAQAPKG